MNKEKFFRVVLPLGLSAVILIILAVYVFGGVKQTNDKVTHEAGNTLVLNAADFFDVSKETAEKITFDTSMVDENTVGTYEVTASYKMHQYTITVEVKDTQAPEIVFQERYCFTNDIEGTDLQAMTEGIYDASEYTLKLVRFEKSGSLCVMTDSAIKQLTDSIALPGDEEELVNLGTDVVPTEEGIYRAVLAATDSFGNTRFEEVYVILDTTGARIEDVPDKEVYVSADKLTEAPEISPEEYVITDNVDGRVSAKDIDCEPELRDETKHEWLVHVSYTDRAGNESRAEFLIVVKEAGDGEQISEPGQTETPSVNPGTTETDNQKPDESEKNDTEQPDNGGTDNGSQQPEYTYKELNKTMYASASVNVRDLPSSDGDKLGRLSDGNAVTVTGQCNETKWYRIDYNGKTGYVSASYLTDTKPEKELTEEEKKEEAEKQTELERQQKAIDAGYWNVVQLDEDTYAVWVPSSDATLDGKRAGEILDEYLAELRLAARSVSGEYMAYRDGYYWWKAYNLYVQYLPEDEEFWD